MNPNPLLELANRWRICHGAQILNRWKFSRQLLEFVGDHPEFTYTEIGSACGKAIKEKPYSSMWVLRNVKAARAFPIEPKDDTERAAFNRLLHGYTETKVLKHHMTARPEQIVARAVGLLRMAIEAGASPESVISEVTSQLRGKARAAA